MQSFLAERFTASRYRDAAFGAYEAARAMTPGARVRHRGRAVPRFRQRRRRALARRAGSDRRPDDWRRVVAVRAVRRVRRGRARTIVGSVERGLASGGRRRAHRRDHGGQAAHCCARSADQTREAGPWRACFPQCLALPIRGVKTAPCCATSASASRPGRLSPLSARRAPANRPCSSWRSGSMIPRAARSCSTGSTFRGSIPPTSGPRSRSCRRTPSSSGPPSPTTSPMARRARPGKRSSPPPNKRPRTVSSPPCRRATTPLWASAASRCRAASASASPSLARSSRTRPCCFWTKRRQPSTPKAKPWFRARLKR